MASKSGGRAYNDHCLKIFLCLFFFTFRICQSSIFYYTELQGCSQTFQIEGQQGGRLRPKMTHPHWPLVRSVTKLPPYPLHLYRAKGFRLVWLQNTSSGENVTKRGKQFKQDTMSKIKFIIKNTFHKSITSYLKIWNYSSYEQCHHLWCHNLNSQYYPILSK